jgi:8-oxo-dGTP diphosphatase
VTSDHRGADDATGGERRPVVGVQAIVLRKRQVLLGRREGSFGAGTWGLPGGHLEFGESFEDAAERELEEETGIRAIRSHAVGSVNTPYEKTHYVQVAVQITKWEGDPEIREPDKCSGLSFFPLVALPEPLFAPSHEILVRVINAEFLDLTSAGMCIYLNSRDVDSNRDRYINYILLEGEPATLVMQLGRRGQRPRQERTRFFGTLPEALHYLAKELATRIRHGYRVYDCTGSMSLDQVRQLLPSGHHLAFRTVESTDVELDIYSDRAQLSLFDVSGGAEDD